MTGRRARIAYRLGALVRPRVTLGVRCLVTDEGGRVLVVKHTYASGWHLPGGGVDPGETAREAAVREVREETGVALTSAPTFVALYFNRALEQRDHVALFAALGQPIAAEALRPIPPEIAAIRLVRPEALPEGTSAATRRRLTEVLEGAAMSEDW